MGSIDSRDHGEIAPTEIVGQAVRRVRSDSHTVRHADAVRIEFEAGRLVLTGRAPNYYTKQVLQAVLAGLPGVDVIENHVRVVATGVTHPTGGGAP